MEKHSLHIKNMVCPRCISSVEGILARLNIPFEKVSLGNVDLKKALSSYEEENFQKELKKVGFELITDKHQRISNQIKSLILDWVHQEENSGNKNLSDILTEKLHRDYSFLSHVFTKTEGKSIQQFQADVKIMRIKELLEYDELNVSEIADVLGYGNAAYLSTHFKKATGLTPSQYKIQVSKNRGTLDEL
ncbi:MAG TPA: helix-turn-helix domain-containing protein [Flavobacteriaceae bacterium]|nr:helix-turn-helix domain-containing protein [Flavobacteriaceae bacterium]